jgi:predicted ArsR family transcriptional regulator
MTDDFVRSHVHRDDPDTSRAAAAQVTTAASHRAALVAAFKREGPMTAEEAAACAGLEHVPAQRRISDLLNDGLLLDTGLRRPGSSGREMRILALTEDWEAA